MCVTVSVIFTLEKPTESESWGSLGRFWAPLVVQMLKNLPAMWETWIQSLGWEDLLEKRIVIILTWRIPWTEDPGGLQSMGVSKSQI